jgi:hypothetical protein
VRWLGEQWWVDRGRRLEVMRVAAAWLLPGGVRVALATDRGERECSGVVRCIEESDMDYLLTDASWERSS